MGVKWAFRPLGMVRERSSAWNGASKITFRLERCVEDYVPLGTVRQRLRSAWNGASKITFHLERCIEDYVPLGTVSRRLRSAWNGASKITFHLERCVEAASELSQKRSC